MEIRILGPLEVVRDGTVVRIGGAKQRAVLGQLALHVSLVVSSAALLAQCWPEHDERKARAALQVAMTRLRAIVGTGAIETVPNGYRLSLPADSVDAHRFERLARRGRAELQAGRFSDAARALSEALDLWRGEALLDVVESFAEPSDAYRLDEDRARAANDLLEARLGEGRHLEVLDEFAEAVARRPLDERLAGLWMLALYRAERQGDALAVAQRLRHHLSEELGIDPSGHIVILEQQVLQQDPALDGTAGRRTAMETLRRVPDTDDGLRAWVRVDDRRIALDRAVTTIGRLEDRTVVLRDPDVSRRHAEIRRLAGRYVIADLGSTNGTRVDGEEVREHELSSGQRIEVGASTLTFEIERT